MTTRNTTKIECSRFGTFGIHAVYLLSLTLVLCILLLIWRSKIRAAVLDTEIGIPYPTVDGTDAEKRALYLEFGQVTDKQMHAAGFFDPFANAEYLNSGHFTSGFLAAKADMDNAEKAAGAGKKSLRTIPGPQMDSRTPGTVEDQQASCRRHSYPSDQDQNGGLRGDSLHDNTEHFCDNHDAGIIWRRRTMIFQDKP